jgi:hypothetical protein
MIIPLPGGAGLDRAVVTAGAADCQRATADYLHGRGADFILPAKDNQPRLSGARDARPGRDVPAARAATGRGHGRTGTRTIQLDAPGDLPFPHVSQAYLIERHVTARDGTPGIASLDATRASPRPPPARLARRNMGRPFTIPGLTSRSSPRPRATARKAPGSYQEAGQHQERCQTVAPISNDDRPAVRASRSLAPVPAGTRKGAARHDRERTVRQGPSSAAGCPGR